MSTKLSAIVTALLALSFCLPAYSADSGQIIDKDSSGNTTVFKRPTESVYDADQPHIKQDMRQSNVNESTPKTKGVVFKYKNHKPSSPKFETINGKPAVGDFPGHRNYTYMQSLDRRVPSSQPLLRKQDMEYADWKLIQKRIERQQHHH